MEAKLYGKMNRDLCYDTHGETYHRIPHIHHCPVPSW